VDRSSDESALLGTTKTPGGVRYGEGYGLSPQSPPGRGLGRRLDPPQKVFYYFTSKLSILALYFKPDLMEETRTQLQKQKAIIVLPPLAPYWLRLCGDTSALQPKEYVGQRPIISAQNAATHYNNWRFWLSYYLRCVITVIVYSGKRQYMPPPHTSFGTLCNGQVGM